MGTKNKGVERYLKDVTKTLHDRTLFTAAFEGAETASLYIDRAARKIFSKRSTGMLAGSFNAVPVIMSGDEITAGAYSPLPYAAIHEEGGRVTPKQSKSLAIPLTKKAFNTGSPRKWSGKKLVYLPPKPGAGPKAAGVFATERRGGKMVAEYMLRYFVDIKPRGYISQAATEAAPVIEEDVAGAIEHVFASTHIFEIKEG